MSLPPYTDQVANPQEQGFPQPAVIPDPLDLPPSGGAFNLPHFTTFSQLVNYVTRTYRYTTDEALRHCVNNALAMRNEPVIMQALRTRQMPVCQLSWHLEPKDPNNSTQKEAAEFLSDTINQTWRLQQFLRCLEEAIWYGKYGVQLAYRWDWTTGYKRMVAASWVPINGDKLVYKFDGRVGVLVHAAYTGPTERTDRGLAHFFDSAERQAVVVHEWEPEDSDFFQGEMAGAVHGTGIRGRIYWLWWIRSQVIAWMLDYLERVGAGGFTIVYYEHGNQASYQEVKTTFESQLNRNTILFPRYRDNTTGGPGIQRIDPNPAGQQLLSTLISEYFDAVIRRFILGTNGTADQGPTGVGEGWADLHAGEFARIVKYDAVDLQETLNSDFIPVMNKYDCPGNPCPKLMFELDTPNADEYMQGAKAYFEMGGQLDDESVRMVLGLPAPKPGHAILSQIQPQAPVPVQPGAMPGDPAGQPMPEGVPFEGDPNPSAGGQPVQMSRKVQRWMRLAKQRSRQLEALKRGPTTASWSTPRNTASRAFSVR